MPALLVVWGWEGVLGVSLSLMCSYGLCVIVCNMCKSRQAQQCLFYEKGCVSHSM